MPSSSEESAQAPQPVANLLESHELAQAVETEEFRAFLDHVPIAIAVSKLVGNEQRIVYANKAFEALAGTNLAGLTGKAWTALDAFRLEDEPHLTFSAALPAHDDFVGTFKRDEPSLALVEIYSNLIENEDSGKTYRIVALIDVAAREKAQREEFARKLRDKDTLLKEIQHRVKNNLQLITALIRLEARNQRGADNLTLERLAGRIESLQLLYQDLVADGLGQSVDLGHYVSQIATAVMHTYAVTGIRLDLKVDHAVISVNVAMPVGLLLNELLTNAFKYAFTGRKTGTIVVRCLHQEGGDYRIVVGDDGVGLPEGASWPQPGKLGALVLQTLKENAETDLQVESTPGAGARFTITFRHTTPVRPHN